LPATGIGCFKKRPVIQAFIFKPILPPEYPALIFCQKKYLPLPACSGQDKTTKFDLLTLMKI
jgi:hypothetical protein